jgi:hypothetical protein
VGLAAALEMELVMKVVGKALRWALALALLALLGLAVAWVQVSVQVMALASRLRSVKVRA